MTGQAPIVLRGVLGWGNRKSGLEAYGPGGRWNRDPADGTARSDPEGDLLGDALERAGAGEGSSLIIVAVPPGGDHEGVARSVFNRLGHPLPPAAKPRGSGAPA